MCTHNQKHHKEKKKNRKKSKKCTDNTFFRDQIHVRYFTCRCVIQTPIHKIPYTKTTHDISHLCPCPTPTPHKTPTNQWLYNNSLFLSPCARRFHCMMRTSGLFFCDCVSFWPTVWKSRLMRPGNLRSSRCLRTSLKSSSAMDLKQEMTNATVPNLKITAKTQNG